MKWLFVICFTWFSSSVYSQVTVTVDTVPMADDKDYVEILNFFDSNNIVLNKVSPPEGFTLYYNCDSMLFMRGDFGDTIRIWTPSSTWSISLSEFKKAMLSPEYGRTVFAEQINIDGRIMLASYMQTQFVYRNDSLFQVEDTLSLPGEFYDLLSQKIQRLVPDSIIERKMDSIRLSWDGIHAYVPKLIYAKNMFKGTKKKVKLPKTVNYLGDEIVLEEEWVQHGKKSFVIRINNVWKGEETSYAYALNEDMEFVRWQGCRSR